MCLLHPVFSVVKLLHAPVDPIPGRRPAPPPDPVVIKGEPQYELKAVLNSHLYSNSWSLGKVMDAKKTPGLTNETSVPCNS
jgi:hypothetical protein